MKKSIKSMITPVVRDIPPSGIRKFFDIVNEMKDAISLSIGQPDFTTPENIIKAGINSLASGRTHYSPNVGFIELRETIAAYMNRKYNLDYDPKRQILVTVGGSEAIDLALRALVGPGDEVAIPEPSYVSYVPCTIFTGAKPNIIKLQMENEFRLTPDLLEKALTPLTKVLILPYPNNPTGAVMEKEDLEAIAEILREREIIVISDELYAELSYTGGRHVSIATLPGMKDQTLVINGLSKAFAMTGWRLGYVCGHPDLIDAMYKIHQYAIMCSPTTAQDAAIEALSERSDEAVASMVREYDGRRKVMLAGYREAGLACFEPRGAFYVFPCIKSTDLTSEQFAERLLAEEKVAVVPGTAFGESAEGYVRSCYAASMENIIEAMKRIKRFTDRNKKLVC